jgi:predicted PurR-regulated permease PerM
MFLIRQIPEKFRRLAFDIKDFLISCLWRLLRAYGIIMFITFCELSIGLWALKIDSFWKVAAVTAMLDILPMIGSGAVLLPWSVYHLLGGELWMGIGLLILYCVIAVVRNIIEPRIVGDQLDLPPVVTLAAMFLGMRTMGIAGILIMPIIVLLIRFLNESGKIHLYRS